MIKPESIKQVMIMDKCKGYKCTSTDGRNHSPECLLEHDKATDRRSPAWRNAIDNPPPRNVEILVYCEQGMRRAYLNCHGDYMSSEVFSTRYKVTYWMKIEPPKD